MLKKTSLIFTALLLAGCAQNANVTTPQTQKMQVEKVDKALQKAKLTDIYVKMIKLFVLYTPRIKNTKKICIMLPSLFKAYQKN